MWGEKKRKITSTLGNRTWKRTGQPLGWGRGGQERAEAADRIPPSKAWRPQARARSSGASWGQGWGPETRGGDAGGLPEAGVSAAGSRGGRVCDGGGWVRGPGGETRK